MSIAPGTEGEAFAALALDLAELARPIALRHFRAPMAVETKPDQSPVTIADRTIEAVLREAIRTRFPEHGVIGEEHGSERADAEFVWVLDPIDGTKSFITGKPLFGTLIGLARAGRPVLGVVSMPALGEVWVGGKGLAARCNGAPVRVRACAALGDAMAYATTPAMFVRDDARRHGNLARLVKHALWGADCYAYAMIAAGWSDLAVEAALAPYDYMACAALVEAAGGIMTDWSGAPLTVGSGDKVIACGDPRLLAPALAALSA